MPKDYYWLLQTATANCKLLQIYKKLRLYGMSCILVSFNMGINSKKWDSENICFPAPFLPVKDNFGVKFLFTGQIFIEMVVNVLFITGHSVHGNPCHVPQYFSKHTTVDLSLLTCQPWPNNCLLFFPIITCCSL